MTSWVTDQGSARAQSGALTGLVGWVTISMTKGFEGRGCPTELKGSKGSVGGLVDGLVDSPNNID